MAFTCAGNAVIIIGAVLFFCSVHIDATKVWNDVDNCGRCKHTCPRAPPHSDRTCNRGKFGFKCKGTWRDCDERKSNGCETNVESDLNNCGACDMVCPEPPRGGGGRGGGGVGVATCIDGDCGMSCDNSGFADCDGILGNGCEQDVWFDANNCGSCGHVCPVLLNTVSSSCQSGSCGFSVCKAGFADCDGVASNGCERDLSVAITAGETCGTCSTDVDCLIYAPFLRCHVSNGNSSGTCTADVLSP